jgi:GH15 family glucan-1,4-alpha-glucosidase
MEAVEKGLWINTEVGGIARYTADCYFKRSQDIRICPGNPWVLCTLWLAQWHARRASRAEELDRALELLNWANSKALPGGMLPEQLDPYTGTPLSVTPLTWSHATYIMAVLDYLEKKSSFTPIV